MLLYERDTSVIFNSIIIHVRKNFSPVSVCSYTPTLLCVSSEATVFYSTHALFFPTKTWSSKLAFLHALVSPQCGDRMLSGHRNSHALCAHHSGCSLGYLNIADRCPDPEFDLMFYGKQL